MIFHLPTFSEGRLACNHRGTTSLVLVAIVHLASEFIANSFDQFFFYPWTGPHESSVCQFFDSASLTISGGGLFDLLPYSKYKEIRLRDNWNLPPMGIWTWPQPFHYSTWWSPTSGLPRRLSFVGRWRAPASTWFRLGRSNCRYQRNIFFLSIFPLGVCQGRTLRFQVDFWTPRRAPWPKFRESCQPHMVSELKASSMTFRLKGPFE